MGGTSREDGEGGTSKAARSFWRGQGHGLGVVVETVREAQLAAPSTAPHPPPRHLPHTHGP